LNWRYRQNPTAEYTVITARRNSALMGYLVTRKDQAEATLADIMAIDVDRTVPALLAYASQLLSGEEFKRFSASLLGDSALAPHFRLAGFIPREGLPVVVHGEMTDSVEMSQPRNWLLLHGDRES